MIDMESPGTCEEKDGCWEEEGKATRLLGKRRVPMNAFPDEPNCGVRGYRLQAGFISRGLAMIKCSICSYQCDN